MSGLGFLSQVKKLIPIIIFAAVFPVFSFAAQVTMSFESGPIPFTPVTTNPWVPTGSGEHVPPPECQASTLEESIANSSSADHTRILQEYFSRCEARLAQFGLHQLLSLSKLARVKYDFLENPNIREVKFTISENFSDGTSSNEIVRGLVAIKPNSGPRPWLFIKCGLFCSVGDSTLFRNLLMHGFDESPFNVLILNSNTGKEFYLDNHHLSIGGIDEGRQTILLANWLRQDSPFKENISSLHLLGVSNGGQAALFAASYNDSFRNAGGRRPLDSVNALCPVVNLQNSTQYLFEHSQVHSLFYRQFMDTLNFVYSSVPALQHYVDLAHPPIENQITGLVSNLGFDYYSHLPSDWGMAPFTSIKFQGPQDVYALNDFTSHAADVTTPTLVWAPQNDGVVNFADNAGLLVSSMATQPNPKLDILATAHGNHCGFSLAYGWNVLSAVLRAHILAHSPEFSNSRQVNTQNITIDTVALNPDERHVSQEWIASAGQDFFTLNYKVWKKNAAPNPAVHCEVGPFEAQEQFCFEKRSVRVPFSAIPISSLAVPQSTTMAEVLTRWMNANVVLLDSNHNKITDSTENPAFVQWITYSP